MQIAIATVGTRGDIAPFVALGIALRQAGHDVHAVSWDRWRGAFEDAGIGFSAAGPTTTDENIAETARRAAAARSPLDQVAILRDFHIRDGAEHARQLRDLLGQADVAVIHGIHSLAQAAATDIGLPYATAVFDPVLLPTASAPPPGMPSLGPLNGVLWWMLDRMLRRLDGPLHAELSRAGIGSDGLRLFRGRSSRLHLVGCSPSLIVVPGDLPPTTIVTGAWSDPRPPEPLAAALDTFLAGGDPPVLVTFGSMASDASEAHATAVRAALAETGMRAVVQGLPLEASPSVHPAGDVDHRSLLPRVALAVHHGGAGTTHAVVAAGLPSVVVPHIGDQRYWAQRLHRLGVAPPPLAPDELDGPRLGAAIRAANQPELRERATRLSAALASEGGLARAVELIGSRLMAGGQPAETDRA